MQAGIFPKAGFVGVALLVLNGCDEGASFGQQTFRGQYAVARNALEAGQYDLAARTYAKLVDKAGPLTPRIQLEYSHAQLRAGNFDVAASQARALANGQSGTARAAALAVQATADHERAISALAAGNRALGKRLLKAADKAMAEVLKSHASLDPLGALAARRSSIKVRLKSL